ncbi:MAG: DNA-3-methyladenine glycosylase [Actinomycetaceae bacterium]|nr:DNA-3-methyladenine glycosylase [Actinomycetaceae bacterium]
MTDDLVRRLLHRATLVAPTLLGAVLTHTDGELSVGLRITEVEAYEGDSDPGSHAFRGETPRTRPMFARPPRVYIYLSYGIHSCVNIVCAPQGVGHGCLVRAGELLWGSELMGERRPRARNPRDWARGPGNVGAALAVSPAMSGSELSLKALPSVVSPGEKVAEERGATKAHSSRSEDSPNGVDWRALLEPAQGISLYLPATPAPVFEQSGRIGVSGEGGDPTRFPWRFYLPGEPSVSRHPRPVAGQ